MLGRIPRLKAWIPTVGIAFAFGNASRNLSVSIGGFIEILAEDSVAQGFFEGFLRRQSWRKDSWGRERGGGFVKGSFLDCETRQTGSNKQRFSQDS